DNRSTLSNTVNDLNKLHSGEIDVFFSETAEPRVKQRSQPIQPFRRIVAKYEYLPTTRLKIVNNLFQYFVAISMDSAYETSIVSTCSFILSSTLKFSPIEPRQKFHL